MQCLSRRIESDSVRTRIHRLSVAPAASITRNALGPVNGGSMEERYPFIRFVIGSAHLVAVAVAFVLFFGGTARACELGGTGGFVSFVVTLALAAVGYVGAMVWAESLRVFLDIEENTQQLVASARWQESTAAAASKTDPGEPNAD